MNSDHPKFSEKLIPLENTGFSYGDVSISRREGEFLSNAIRDHGYERTIEIGCALGISSLYICDALSGLDQPSHTIIDPNQTDGWQSVGIRNLNEHNFDFYELVEQPSELALPRLLEQGRSFDLGFIDGYHTFDHALVDFFYLNRMIRVGGMIIFDDVSFPSISKLIRYLRNYPAYELVLPTDDRTGSEPFSIRQNVLRMFVRVAKLFPERTRKQLFSDRVNSGIIRVPELTSIVGLKKVSEDERRWDWYEEFS